VVSRCRYRGQVNPAGTLLPALFGLLTGLSLIIAIGAQNAFVLRVGIAGRNRIIGPVVLICALSDAVLILAGVAGIGALIQRAPIVLIVIRIIGAGFLIVYGLLAAWRVFHPKQLEVTGGGPVKLSRAILTALALTWLNPHVYLDTLILLGSIANQQGPSSRWWWAAGAIFGSVLWFSALGFGARLLKPFFARPRSWQILDAIIAVVMIAIGIRIAFGL
jgi:L-lysine exporter family protein LysE/ArgO